MKRGQSPRFLRNHPLELGIIQNSALWSLSLSRAGLAVCGCNCMDIQRRFAAENAAATAYQRRHPNPAIGTASASNHISPSRFSLQWQRGLEPSVQHCFDTGQPVF
jgi:hypothetical protein